VEVLGPEKLRDEMKKSVLSMTETYQ